MNISTHVIDTSGRQRNEHIKFGHQQQWTWTFFEVLDEKDHQVLGRLRQQQLVPADLRIRHETKAEIMLTICDLIAGARTDHLCALDSGPYAMIGQRVQTIRQIAPAS